jgi:MFS family permease
MPVCSPTSLSAREFLSPSSPWFSNNVRYQVHSCVTLPFPLTSLPGSGINAILYYAAFIFQALGLTGNTTSLLAGGVGGILLMFATIPAVLYIDQLGRKPLLIAGALGMGTFHIIVAGLFGAYGSHWPQHIAAGWVAVVCVWLYEVCFGFSWGVSIRLYS